MVKQQSADNWGSLDSKLIALIVHELRNPLTAIRGYSDLLLQETAGALSDTQTSFVRMIHANSNKMAELITMLSDISRLNEGRLNFSTAPLPLDGYVEQAVEQLKPISREKSILIETTVSRRLPKVLADPIRLNQVLVHLIKNAIDYNAGDSKVELMAEGQGNEITITIQDQGIGINKALQAQVFMPFFRANDLALPGVEGWGLGLSLSKMLVEHMGGKIGFESQHKEGSSFWFSLPAAQTD